MDQWWWIPLAAIGFFAVVLVLNGMVKLSGGRWLSGLLRLVLGTGLSWACLGLALLGLNLQTYPPVTQGEPIATLSFKRIDQKAFDATLTRPGRHGMIDDVRIYRLGGDQWQLEARSITWHPRARWLGLGSHVRLEALTGLAGTELALDRERRNAHRLHDGEPAVGIGGFTLPWQPTAWATTRKLSPYLDVLAPRPVDTPPMPMQDGSRFEISLTPSGLVARPIASTQAEERQAIEAGRGMTPEQVSPSGT